MNSYLSQIEWPGPLLHLYEFVGIFLALGAIGFRYTSLHGHMADADTDVFLVMAKRAALLGLLGAILTLAHIIEVLPRVAAREKLAVSTMLLSPKPAAFWFYLTLLAMMGFGLAALHRRVGWHLAAIGIVGGLLRNFYLLDWKRMVTPMHMLMGGLWIGTLFVLLVAGILTVMKHERRAGTRSTIVADMVNAFSPLALTCGILVVAFGVLAAFREIRPISGLWTTAFGYTLIAKVFVVAIVLILGAWNWRRQRPSLGTDDATIRIKRSATSELIAAAIVLLITSIMVSLPEPH